MTSIGASNTDSPVLPCQPPPDVYNQFDEVILLSEGHIIYHGMPFD
jgi:hypothetical protein